MRVGISDKAELKHAPNQAGSNEVREMTVSSVDRETDRVMIITLTEINEELLPAWEPGAHIDVVLKNGLERQYSLCGNLEDRINWKIAVLRTADSRGGSQYIHEQLDVGDVIHVRGPRNNFPLEPARSYLFIAGGIGITPLLPMIKRVRETGASWHLAYGGLTEASKAFLDQISRFGASVGIWPEDKRGAIDLDEVFQKVDPHTNVYCCGPEGLIDVVGQRCKNELPPGSLRVERFTPKVETYPRSRIFEVYLAFSDLAILVPEDQTIVEALEAHGISVATSCREGTCGTCETTILEGIPEHRDSVLSEEERNANETMMICCSRSRSHRLVLDL